MLGAKGARPGAQEGEQALWAGWGLLGEATLGEPLGSAGMPPAAAGSVRALESVLGWGERNLGRGFSQVACLYDWLVEGLRVAGEGRTRHGAVARRSCQPTTEGGPRVRSLVPQRSSQTKSDTSVRKSGFSP